MVVTKVKTFDKYKDAATCLSGVAVFISKFKQIKLAKQRYNVDSTRQPLISDVQYSQWLRIISQVR